MNRKPAATYVLRPARPRRHRVGEAQLAAVTLPVRSQEPYRYTDLESLYRTDFFAASAGGKVSEEGAALVDKYRLGAAQGQQMVFVNGIFSPSLSDVSELRGVEGVFAGSFAELEGNTLEEVRRFPWRCSRDTRYR